MYTVTKDVESAPVDECMLQERERVTAGPSVSSVTDYIPI